MRSHAAHDDDGLKESYSFGRPVITCALWERLRATGPFMSAVNPWIDLINLQQCLRSFTSDKTETESQLTDLLKAHHAAINCLDMSSQISVWKLQQSLRALDPKPSILRARPAQPPMMCMAGANIAAMCVADKAVKPKKLQVSARVAVEERVCRTTQGLDAVPVEDIEQPKESTHRQQRAVDAAVGDDVVCEPHTGATVVHTSKSTIGRRANEEVVKEHIDAKIAASGIKHHGKDAVTIVEVKDEEESDEEEKEQELIPEGVLEEFEMWLDKQGRSEATVRMYSQHSMSLLETMVKRLEVKAVPLQEDEVLKCWRANGDVLLRLFKSKRASFVTGWNALIRFLEVRETAKRQSSSPKKRRSAELKYAADTGKVDQGMRATRRRRSGA